MNNWWIYDFGPVSMVVIEQGCHDAQGIQTHGGEALNDEEVRRVFPEGARRDPRGQDGFPKNGVSLFLAKFILIIIEGKNDVSEDIFLQAGRFQNQKISNKDDKNTKEHIFSKVGCHQDE